MIYDISFDKKTCRNVYVQISIIQILQGYKVYKV